MRDIFFYCCGVAENEGRFTPKRFTDKQFDALGELSEMYERFGRCSAGVVMKFITASEVISFKYRVSGFYTSVGSFDVYENGVLYENITFEPVEAERTFSYDRQTKGKALIEIYLPSNACTEIWDFEAGEYIAAEPEEIKIMFYGDSITQCAYMHSSSLTFASLTGRIKSMGYINRGVGSLYYDASTLDEKDTVKPEYIFVEFGANDVVMRKNKQVVYEDGKVCYYGDDDLPRLRGKINAYLSKLRSIYPEAKVLVMSMLWNKAGGPNLSRAFYERYREEIRLSALSNDCDYVDGRNIIPHLDDCLVPTDRVHLTRLGAAMAAISLSRYID
ncbi:MAG: SGNH/GDSL hydrolase family protein [Clostridiales bacterium]|mgnify:CR=1 FL=1|jgi:hypothetical protein|nr:SGNH/GDSL hydrolase family protein [Clostridiales bacterium]